MLAMPTQKTSAAMQVILMTAQSDSSMLRCAAERRRSVTAMLHLMNAALTA
jgi:hypothetical protein